MSYSHYSRTPRQSRGRGFWRGRGDYHNNRGSYHDRYSGSSRPSYPSYNKGYNTHGHHRPASYDRKYDHSRSSDRSRDRRESYDRHRKRRTRSRSHGKRGRSRSGSKHRHSRDRRSRSRSQSRSSYHTTSSSRSSSHGRSHSRDRSYSRSRSYSRGRSHSVDRPRRKSRSQSPSHRLQTVQPGPEEATSTKLKGAPIQQAQVSVEPVNAGVETNKPESVPHSQLTQATEDMTVAPQLEMTTVTMPPPSRWERDGSPDDLYSGITEPSDQAKLKTNASSQDKMSPVNLQKKSLVITFSNDRFQKTSSAGQKPPTNVQTSFETAVTPPHVADPEPTPVASSSVTDAQKSLFPGGNRPTWKPLGEMDLQSPLITEEQGALMQPSQKPVPDVPVQTAEAGKKKKSKADLQKEIRDLEKALEKKRNTKKSSEETSEEPLEAEKEPQAVEPPKGKEESIKSRSRSASSGQSESSPDRHRKRSRSRGRDRGRKRRDRKGKRGSSSRDHHGEKSKQERDRRSRGSMEKRRRRPADGSDDDDYRPGKKGRGSKEEQNDSDAEEKEQALHASLMTTRTDVPGSTSMVPQVLQPSPVGVAPPYATTGISRSYQPQPEVPQMLHPVTKAPPLSSISQDDAVDQFLKSLGLPSASATASTAVSYSASGPQMSSAYNDRQEASVAVPDRQPQVARPADDFGFNFNSYQEGQRLPGLDLTPHVEQHVPEEEPRSSFQNADEEDEYLYGSNRGPSHLPPVSKPPPLGKRAVQAFDEESAAEVKPDKPKMEKDEQLNKILSAIGFDFDMAKQIVEQTKKKEEQSREQSQLRRKTKKSEELGNPETRPEPKHEVPAPEQQEEKITQQPKPEETSPAARPIPSIVSRAAASPEIPSPDRALPEPNEPRENTNTDQWASQYYGPPSTSTFYQPPTSSVPVDSIQASLGVPPYGPPVPTMVTAPGEIPGQARGGLDNQGDNGPPVPPQAIHAAVPPHMLSGRPDGIPVASHESPAHMPLTHGQPAHGPQTHGLPAHGPPSMHGLPPLGPPPLGPQPTNPGRSPYGPGYDSFPGGAFLPGQPWPHQFPYGQTQPDSGYYRRSNSPGFYSPVSYSRSRSRDSYFSRSRSRSPQRSGSFSSSRSRSVSPVKPKAKKRKQKRVKSKQEGSEPDSGEKYPKKKKKRMKRDTSKEAVKEKKKHVVSEKAVPKGKDVSGVGIKVSLSRDQDDDSSRRVITMPQVQDKSPEPKEKRKARESIEKENLRQEKELLRLEKEKLKEEADLLIKRQEKLLIERMEKKKREMEKELEKSKRRKEKELGTLDMAFEKREKEIKKREEIIMRVEGKLRKEQEKRILIEMQMKEEQQQKLDKEKNEYKRRLYFLEKELERLKKNQGELLRKKQKEKDGHKDPEVMEGVQLQEEIVNQIKRLKHAYTEAYGKPLPSEIEEDRSGQRSRDSREKSSRNSEETSSSDKGRRREVEKEPAEGKAPFNFIYFDSGDHWCMCCNKVLSDINGFLIHLHSKNHMKNCDPHDRPWQSLIPAPKKPSPSASNVIQAPIKGEELLVPTNAFYCRLCKIFLGDLVCASEHLRQRSHNLKYLKFAEENPFYEKQIALKRDSINPNKDSSPEPEEREQDNPSESKKQERKVSAEDARKRFPYIGKRPGYGKPSRYERKESREDETSQPKLQVPPTKPSQTLPQAQQPPEIKPKDEPSAPQPKAPQTATTETTAGDIRDDSGQKDEVKAEEPHEEEDAKKDSSKFKFKFVGGKPLKAGVSAATTQSTPPTDTVTTAESQQAELKPKPKPKITGPKSFPMIGKRPKSKLVIAKPKPESEPPVGESEDKYKEMKSSLDRFLQMKSGSLPVVVEKGKETESKDTSPLLPTAAPGGKVGAASNKTNIAKAYQDIAAKAAEKQAQVTIPPLPPTGISEVIKNTLSTYSTAHQYILPGALGAVPMMNASQPPPPIPTLMIASVVPTPPTAAPPVSAPLVPPTPPNVPNPLMNVPLLPTPPLLGEAPPPPPGTHPDEEEEQSEKDGKMKKILAEYGEVEPSTTTDDGGSEDLCPPGEEKNTDQEGGKEDKGSSGGSDIEDDVLYWY